MLVRALTGCLIAGLICSTAPGAAHAESPTPEPIDLSTLHFVGTEPGGQEQPTEPTDPQAANKAERARNIVNVKCEGKNEWYRVLVRYDNGTPGVYCYARTGGGVWTARFGGSLNVTGLCPGNNGGQVAYRELDWDPFGPYIWSKDRPHQTDPARWDDCYAFEKPVRVAFLRLHD